MGKDRPKPAKSKWYQENLYWGPPGIGLALVGLTVGNYNITAVHLLMSGAWAGFALCAWLTCRNVIRRVFVARLTGAALIICLASGFYYLDKWRTTFVTVSPTALNVPTDATGILEVTVTNHTDAPRYGLWLRAVPTNKTIDCKIKSGDFGPKISMNNGIDIDLGVFGLVGADKSLDIQIFRIAPNGSPLFTFMCRGQSSGQMLFNVDQGNNSPSSVPTYK